jgi:predicted AlkP superfamily pyrophosphatase or phosphodiesterase
MINRFVSVAFALLITCVTHAAGPDPAHPLVLVSIDGLRWDYCDLHPAETPTLRQLKREGVTARGLIPVFPSNTFPNHYTIVTGLYPAHHGIINNHMFDPTTGEFFHYSTVKSARDPKWWGGEPIWITAVKQGQVSACSYWPGSEAEIEGKHATYWRPFDYFDTTFEGRLDNAIRWFERPPAERPSVLTFYIEEINAIGHDYGPDSARLIAQLKIADAQIAQLLARLRAIGMTPNLVIVSDHGMTNVSNDRRIIFDDYVDPAKVQIDDFGSVVMLRPPPADLDKVEQALAKIPHAQVYRAENLPAQFHLQGNPRISPLWVLPDEGWRIETRAASERPRRTGEPLRGDHGYDPALPNMRGTFIAAGPAFKAGVQLPEIENIHLYNLLCALAGLKPAPNDGDDRLVKAALR